jgi:antitoxin VapB
LGIFIKNPNVERKARELARLEGKTLTAVIEQALDEKLERRPKPPRPRPTLEEMRAATDEFRRAIGLDKVKVTPMTKKDWDALWPTGIPEIDET